MLLLLVAETSLKPLLALSFRTVVHVVLEDDCDEREDLLGRRLDENGTDNVFG